MATMTSSKVYEVVRALGVEIGAESNTGDGTGLHGVIMEGINCKMDVTPKIETEMGKVSRRMASDDCGGAYG